MAKRNNTQTPPDCAKCAWKGTRLCPECVPGECTVYDPRLDVGALRSHPAVVAIKTELSKGAYTVPRKARTDLRSFLLAAQEQYLPRADMIDNPALGKQLGALSARLQAYRDRTVAIMDDVTIQLARVKYLKDAAEAELALLSVVQRLSTKDQRDKVVNLILQPVHKRYTYLSDLKDLSVSVLFNLKSGLETVDRIIKVHDTSTRIR